MGPFARRDETLEVCARFGWNAGALANATGPVGIAVVLRAKDLGADADSSHANNDGLGNSQRRNGNVSVTNVPRVSTLPTSLQEISAGNSGQKETELAGKM